MSVRLHAYSIEAALRVAEIIGPQSAAAQALAELHRRQSSGEDAALFLSGNAFVVGPKPQDLQP